MSYDTEFPNEYHDIPAPILQLVCSGILSDLSWHNDITPRFTGRGVCVWVHPVGREQRETPEYPRIGVSAMIGDQLADGDYIFECESVEDAMAFLQTRWQDLEDLISFAADNGLCTVAGDDYHLTSRTEIESYYRTHPLQAIQDAKGGGRDPRAVLQALELVPFTVTLRTATTYRVWATGEETVLTIYQAGQKAILERFEDETTMEIDQENPDELMRLEVDKEHVA